MILETDHFSNSCDVWDLLTSTAVGPQYKLATDPDPPDIPLSSRAAVLLTVCSAGEVTSGPMAPAQRETAKVTNKWRKWCKDKHL